MLLLTAAFCDTLGTYGDGFYKLAAYSKELAEEIRRTFEPDGARRVAYFMPCEMVAFRVTAADAVAFGGFASLRRLSDRALYLFRGGEGDMRWLFADLVSEGFGRRGVIRNGQYCRASSALLLAVCAERQNGVFSRISARIPEIRASTRVLAALPIG